VSGGIVLTATLPSPRVASGTSRGRHDPSVSSCRAWLGEGCWISHYSPWPPEGAEVVGPGAERLRPVPEELSRWIVGE
jgi:hypothetical protein